MTTQTIGTTRSQPKKKVKNPPLFFSNPKGFVHCTEDVVEVGLVAFSGDILRFNMTRQAAIQLAVSLTKEANA